MKLFTKLEEGECITRIPSEKVYFVALLRCGPRRYRCISDRDGVKLGPVTRYGVKIFRYPGETGPSIRAWWGTWKSKRLLLSGRLATPSWEGELLAEEIARAPRWPRLTDDQLAEPREIE